MGVKRIDTTGPHVPPVDLAAVQVAQDVTHGRDSAPHPSNAVPVALHTSPESNFRPIEDVAVDGSDYGGYRSLQRPGDYDSDECVLILA